MITASLFFVALAWFPLIDAESFTFPTDSSNRFIVDDFVVVTWNVVTPRLSLYEDCGFEVVRLETNVSDASSYVWTAKRDIYSESGCVFLLEPLGVNGVPSPPNITSPLFGVAKRYFDDPLPKVYSANSTTSASTATPTSTPSSPPLILSTTDTPSAAASSTSSSSDLSTPHVPSPTASSTTSPAPVRPPNPSPDPGLTLAAKVGIGLGVPLGILLLISGAWLLISYRRRWRRRNGAIHDDHGGAVEIGSGAAAARMGHKSQLSDSTTTGVSMLTAVEADGDEWRPVSELLGTPRSELG